MNNDQKISEIAKLVREMSEASGLAMGVIYYPKDDLFVGPRYRVTVGEGTGWHSNPMDALTLALADHERLSAEKAERAEVEALLTARREMREAA